MKIPFRFIVASFFLVSAMASAADDKPGRFVVIAVENGASALKVDTATGATWILVREPQREKVATSSGLVTTNFADEETAKYYWRPIDTNK